MNITKKRAQIEVLLNEGKGVREIERITGCHDVTITNIRRQMKVGERTGLHHYNRTVRPWDEIDISSSIGRLKEIIVAPREQLQPLLRFKGPQNLNRIHALWAFTHSMMFTGCETLSDGTALFRETELPHFCGIHSVQLQRMSLQSFFSRLSLTPKITGMTPGLTEYVKHVLPYAFQLREIGATPKWVKPLTHNQKVLKELERNGKSHEIRYLFSPASAEHQMMTAVHQAIPPSVPHTIRNDLCQDMLCAVIAGEVELQNLPDAIGRYLRDARKLLPHSLEDYWRWGGNKYSEGSPDKWKELYTPVDERTLEEKVDDLQYHFECGPQVPPLPVDIVSPMSVEKPAENFDEMQKRLRKKRLTELLGESYLEKKLHMCTRKKRYPSEGDAQKNAAYQTDCSGRSLRTYLCPFCAGWHLSSHAPEWKAGVISASPSGKLETHYE